MKLFRMLALGTMVAMLAASFSVGDEPKQDTQEKKQEKKGRIQGKGQIQPGQVLGRMNQSALVSEQALEKLKLNDDQKKQYDKIASEYKDKVQKEGRDKIIEAAKGADVEKIQELARNMMRGDEKTRGEYLTKVEAILTDDQKKTFEDVKKEQPRRGAIGGGAAIPGLPGGLPGIGGRISPAPVGDVLSKPAQEKLNLNDEQKKKVEELQKEVETKLKGILNDDQKKQLEDLKNARPGGRGTTPRRPGTNP